MVMSYTEFSIYFMTNCHIMTKGYFTYLFDAYKA